MNTAASRRRTTRIALAALLLPGLLYLVLLPHAGHIQYNDYYGILAQVVDGNHFSTNPIRWLTVKSNEHSVALSLVLYALNVALAHGDNLGLSVESLAMMLVCALLLWSLVPRRLKELHGASPGLALAVGMLAFTPVAVHNVVMGFSGALWLTANALALGAIHCMVTGARGGRPRWFVASGILGLAAALTYSTGIAVWPALLVLAVALRVPWRRLPPVLIPAGLDLLFEVLTYTRPEEIPPPEAGRPLLLVKFLAVYLGQVFARPRLAAGLVGLAGFGLLLALGRRVVREEGWREELAPWLAVGVYGLTNAVVTAIARARLGGARSSRYATLACLVWAAVLVSGAWLVARMRPGPRRRLAAVLAGALVVLGAAAMWVRGAGLIADYLDRAARQPMAEIAWRYGIRDDEVLRSVSMAPEQLWTVRAWLKALGHVPFRGVETIVPGERPPGRVSRGCGKTAVTVAEQVRVGHSVVRLHGAVVGPWPGRRLVLVDRHGAVRGVGTRLASPPLTRLRWPAVGVPWGGYVAGGGPEGLTVLLEVGPGEWCRDSRITAGSSVPGPGR